MPTWLTADEIALRLDRPVSTIRSWRDRYRAFVPERHDAARRQIYPLELLAQIRALQAEGLTTREIRAELERRQGDPSPTASRDDLILEELRAIRAAIERIAARLEERTES